MVLAQFYTELIGAEGMRLLLRKARLGDIPQAQPRRLRDRPQRVPGA
ncbi:hypothetical protein KEH51_16480 [[Brevibacterium] frigoritolerans]|uniref:Uncharacterized protein n=1 Tax=Peribacillus frigoritolerans TaxID=450367 RepID=A0A941J805_9BACI|nr:hypothetical protein [Peribacillus frigoritolerans]